MTPCNVLVPVFVSCFAFVIRLQMAVPVGSSQQLELRRKIGAMVHHLVKDIFVRPCTSE